MIEIEAVVRGRRSREMTIAERARRRNNTSASRVIKQKRQQRRKPLRRP